MKSLAVFHILYQSYFKKGMYVRYDVIWELSADMTHKFIFSFGPDYVSTWLHVADGNLHCLSLFAGLSY